MRGYLAKSIHYPGHYFWALILLLAGQSGFAQSNGFDKTSEGVDEDAAEVKGMSADEVKALEQLDADVARQANEFRKGRESSGIGGAGRFSNILEMHDDYAGTTYHAGPANGLEGRLDKVATGGNNGSETERQKAIADNTGFGDQESNGCKDGFQVQKGPNGQSIKCMNLSPVLVDKGAAHGANMIDTDKDGTPDTINTHRAYELTDDAKKESEKAGADYATQVISDATLKEFSQDSQQAAQAVGVNRSISEQDGGVFVTTTQNGEQVTIQQSPNIDLLRSEYSWLEQQKRDYADRAWKTLRAARLAGVRTQEFGGRDETTEFNSLVSNSMGDKDQDQKLAERIAEKSLLANEQFCIDDNGKPTLAPFDPATKQYSPCPSSGSTAPDPNAFENNLRNLASSRGVTDNTVESLMKSAGFRKKRASNGEELDDWDTTATTTVTSIDLDQLKAVVPTNQISQLYDEARQVAQQRNDKYDQELAEDTQKIIPCLERDKWCYGRTKTFRRAPDPDDPSKPVLYGEVQGDPGAAFDDTREYVYSSYARALRAPLAEQKRLMQNLDFGPGSDANTGSKVWADYEQQWQASMDAYNAFADKMADYSKNGKAYGANGLVNLNTQNQYDRSKWDASRLTQMELFGRDPRRDATFTAGTGEGNGSYNGSIAFNPNNLQNPGSSDRGSSGAAPTSTGAANTAPPRPPALNQQFNLN
ncbi:hypothetical protein GW915_02250 [bacterium]|nr:hypothetical protein [bacterium]